MNQYTDYKWQLLVDGKIPVDVPMPEFTIDSYLDEFQKKEFQFADKEKFEFKINNTTKLIGEKI